MHQLVFSHGDVAVNIVKQSVFSPLHQNTQKFVYAGGQSLTEITSSRPKKEYLLVIAMKRSKRHGKCEFQCSMLTYDLGYYEVDFINQSQGVLQLNYGSYKKS